MNAMASKPGTGRQPTHVSTMIVWPCDSRMRAWIDSGTVPSSFRKCGLSQLTCSSTIDVSAWGNIPSKLTSVLISRTSVIFTSPICHCCGAATVVPLHSDLREPLVEHATDERPDVLDV